MLLIVILVQILCRLTDAQCQDSLETFTVLIEKNSSATGFPYFVAIGHFLENVWRVKCGGTIISTVAVLTAASCLLFEEYGYFTRVGFKSNNSTGKMRNHETEQKVRTNTSYFGAAEEHLCRNVLKVTFHPEFVFNYVRGRYGFYHLNDLAVVVVSPGWPFNYKYEPFFPKIIGPNMKLNLHYNFVTPTLSSVAYGIDNKKLTLTSQIVFAIDRASECTGFWGNVPVKRSICVCKARKLDEIPCDYDRGGPLIWRGVLIGVSWTYVHCENLTPHTVPTTLFADLRKYHEFIKPYVHPNVTFVNDLPVE